MQEGMEESQAGTLAQWGEPPGLTLLKPCFTGESGTERSSALPRATQLIRRAKCRRNAGV